MLYIKNLKVAVDHKTIVHDMSFDVAPGTIHALMGPNGLGKSTFAYSVMGHPAYAVTNGSLLLDCYLLINRHVREFFYHFNSRRC